jgi:hypothetical protein
MRKLIPFLFLVVVHSAAAYDFKGVSIGKAASPADVENKLGVKCGVGFHGIQVCNGSVTIAREPAKMNLVISLKGIVDRIHLTLSPDAFEIVAPELIDKFGKPTSTSHTVVQNRLGAKFPQTVYLWSAKDGTEVLYSKYTSSLDESSLYFSTKADRELMRGSEKERRSDL